jgi:hypothetical protein
MRYDEITKIIEEQIKEFQKNILLKPDKLLENNKFKYKGLSLKLTRYINNKLHTPWLSAEELQSIYQSEIEEGKTSRGNKYYCINNNRVYSSIVHELCFFDKDHTMYIPIKLLFTGDIDKYYNPYFIAKINVIQPLVMLKLLNNDLTFNVKDELLKSDIEIQNLIADKVVIDPYANIEEKTEEIDEEEFFEL